MISLFLSIFLLVLPFIVLPFGSSWYEIPKVISVWIVVSLGAFGFFWNPKNVKKIRLPKEVIFLVGSIFVFSLFDFIFYRTPVSFWGNSFRLQGIFTLWILLIFSLISPHLIQLKKIENWPFYGLIALLVAAIFGVVDPVSRSVALLGEANSLGAIAIFLFVFSPKQRKIQFISFFLALAVILLSGSRSALVGLFIAEGILFLAPRWNAKKVGVIIFLFLIFSLALPFLDKNKTTQDRTEIWQAAVTAGAGKPVLGWGIGNVEVAIKSVSQKKLDPLHNLYVDSSHNIFLDWWVQGGVVGVLMFSAIYFRALYGLVKKKDVRLSAAILGLTAVLLFNPVSIAVLLPFWWLVGEGLQENSTI